MSLKIQLGVPCHGFVQVESMSSSPEQWVSLGEFSTKWGQKDKLGFPCWRHVLFNLPFFSSLTCIPGSLGETLRAATIYCRIKTGNSKQRMGRVVNAGSDATLEKRLPVFQVLFSHYPPWLRWVRATKCSWLQDVPFSSWSLAALAAIYLHGKHVSIGQKTSSPDLCGAGVLTLAVTLKHSSIKTSSAIQWILIIYPHPMSPRLWGLTETSFHEDCHFQPCQRNHTELCSPMIKSCESGASKFIPHFGSQHELHK